MTFRCEKCSYVTNRKYLYDRHKKNKNGCKKKTVCRYCPKTFTTDNTCHKHQKKCPNKIKRLCKHCGKQFTRVSTLHSHFDICKKINENLDEISCLQTYLCPFCHDNFNKTDKFKNHIEICSLKNDGGSSAKTINNTTNNTTNNNNTTNIDNSTTTTTTTNIDNSTTVNNIAVLNFGNENLDFLTERKLRQCFLDPKNSIGNLLEFIHFSKTHPENNNIKIEDSDAKHVKIYDGKSWNYEKIKVGLQKIANNNFYVLEKQYGICRDNMSHRAQENWDDFYYDYLSDEPILVEHVYDKVFIVLQKHRKS